MGRPMKEPNTVKPRKITSKVWQHFGDNLDGVHAFCILCKDHKDKMIVIKALNTTKALRCHLSSFHKPEWKDIVTEEEKEAKENKERAEKAKIGVDGAQSSQPKIQESFNKFTKVDQNGAKQHEYDKRLLDFLACNFVPLKL